MAPEKDQIIKTPFGPGGHGWTQIGEEEIKAVTDLLRTPQLLFRYRGEQPTQSGLLEKELQEKLGVKHALFVNTGTSALTCAVVGLGIGPGDEVIVPAYTYIATASAVINAGAVPVLAEIDDSLGLDPEDVKRKITPQTKGIIVTHMQGVPGRMAALRQVARENKLVLIEDACQAIGSKYQGVYTGVESDAFAWSLNFYKVITSGEGGVYFTNDDKAYLRGIYQADPGAPMWDSGLGKELSHPPFTKAGYRGNEINACLARVQLGKMDYILEHCRKLKKLLLDSLAEPVNYKRQHVDDPEGECGISFAMIAHSSEQARRLSEGLKKEGLNIGSAYNEGFPDRHIYKYWDAVLEKRGTNSFNYPWGDPNYLGAVEYSEDMCPVTLDILERCLRLPINMGMTEQNILEIAQAINSVDKSIYARSGG